MSPTELRYEHYFQLGITESGPHVPQKSCDCKIIFKRIRGDGGKLYVGVTWTLESKLPFDSELLRISHWNLIKQVVLTRNLEL